MATWLKLGLTLGLLTAVIGCGLSGQVSIKGRVTFDGQPVETGSIVFAPEPGSGSTKVAAPIEGGEYEIGAERGASPGTYRVEINWPKKTGRQVASADPGMMMDETEEAIPQKYNTESTLTRELKAGENTHDFDLQAE